MERARLERLFGSVWQAAFDQAGILSRRRLREIGAGDDPSETLEAVIEFLESTPIESWPLRWRGLGKASFTCPSLWIPGLRDGLIDGKVPREDAVLVWDRSNPGQPSASGLGEVLNLAVGYYPKSHYASLPRDHVDRTRWGVWNEQWDSAHGLPLVGGSLRNGGATPEGNVAQWIHRKMLAGDDLEQVMDVLDAQVVGFSRPLVHEFAERYREMAEEDA